ncbi:hypothetical protein BCR44DRAFT_1036399 [Catenaria anguillulae PL171]|uniref:Uncharacterized protein n=1 Tax=Catenaria anguillulae PL171 TaxID=765915 RepID=A0A1Y2HV23_9FUNG|nr:hypothetical protein BCR44DRAFT_1036399 [Catenaria anguillulae PL171]
MCIYAWPFPIPANTKPTQTQTVQIKPSERPPDPSMASTPIPPPFGLDPQLAVRNQLAIDVAPSLSKRASAGAHALAPVTV